MMVNITCLMKKTSFLDWNFYSPGIVNEKIDFMVDARNAGRGRLTGKLTGIKYHTEVEVNDLKDGRYACHYLVPQPGAYVLSLMWNGQHIPDSPYKVTIREAQVMKPNSCFVEGKKLFSVVLLAIGYERKVSCPRTQHSAPPRAPNWTARSVVQLTILSS